jgi:hypothetical protein
VRRSQIQRRVYKHGVLSLYSSFTVLQVEQGEGGDGAKKIPTKGL